MVRRDLILKAEQARKLIERTLATSKTGMTLTEIVEATKLPPPTVKRHLEKLIAIGRVHVEYHRGSTLYYWNGDSKYQDRVYLSKNHILFLDVMVNPWGRPFIRIKESKRNPATGNFEDMGAIIIDEKAVDELIEKLRKLSQNLKHYAE